MPSAPGWLDDGRLRFASSGSAMVYGPVDRDCDAGNGGAPARLVAVAAAVVVVPVRAA
jgi:hypothetical protein